VLGDEEGYEVLRRLRALETGRKVQAHSQLPAIALTGHAGTDDRLRAQQAGFHAYLSKPVSPERLIAEIVRLTGGRRARAQVVDVYEPAPATAGKRSSGPIRPPACGTLSRRMRCVMRCEM
jgi:DNA-binding response OmpR family regulator